jgi:hypothetical protein
MAAGEWSDEARWRSRWPVACTLVRGDIRRCSNVYRDGDTAEDELARRAGMRNTASTTLTLRTMAVGLMSERIVFARESIRALCFHACDVHCDEPGSVEIAKPQGLSIASIRPLICPVRKLRSRSPFAR